MGVLCISLIHKKEITLKNVIHNTLAVVESINKYRDSEEYYLCWQDAEGNNPEFICFVHGYDNAIRVAEGIAHEQVEFVKYPVGNAAL